MHTLFVPVPMHCDKPQEVKLDTKNQRLSGVADVLDLALGVPRHLLVQEEGHTAAVSFAVDTRDERLPAAARARESRRGHHV